MSTTKNIVALTLAACMACAATAAEQPVKAGIVPGADLLLRVEMAKATQTPMYKFLESSFGGQEQSNAKIDELMLTHLGISEDDIVGVIASINTTPILALPAGQKQDWSSLPVSAALLLRKPVSAAKLAAFLDAVSSEVEPVKYEQLAVAGRDAIRLPGETANEPPLLVTFSADGMAVYMALSKPSLEGAVRRAMGQDSTGLSAELSALRQQVPPGSQLTVFYRAPEQLREKIRETAAAAAKPAQGQGMNPMGGMQAGLMKMFENTQSIGLGIALSDYLSVNLGGDLGGAPQAQQTAMMMQNMLIPMLQMQMAQMTPPGQEPINAMELLSVSNQGNMLNIGIRIDQALIARIQEMQKAAIRAAMQGGQSDMMMGPEAPESTPPPPNPMR